MPVHLDVPDLVRQRAISNGSAGRRWLDELPEVVQALTHQWDIELGASIRGGTASFVAAANDSSGRACVLKVAMPFDMDETDMFRRSVDVHQLAAGHACAELYAFDTSTTAILLERLGPNLDELGMPIPQLLETIAATLRSFWRSVPGHLDLPTGADKAAWLKEYIATTWVELEKPCTRAVIDRAIDYCEQRAAAFDPAAAV